ncbi:MAG: hypothetical protein L0219_20170, partial [Phycisphaerales bacterium]|nr:hypothetical protein [Phycisphaerales bacterium]
VHLTVACAQIDRYVASMDSYLQNKAWLAETIRETIDGNTRFGTAVEVNAADGQSPESAYITVTGTSAEAGDDGEAGRGNRINGLITPHRPMTMESVAGKNPINHVGKLYNISAGLIAEAIVRELPQIMAAECYLVSRIGQAIDDPQIADVRVQPRDPAAPLPDSAINHIVSRHLSEMSKLADELRAGSIVIGRWPLRGSQNSGATGGSST